MMRSLFSGVSGLKNHQTKMDVIGNNIANVNTVGFKGSRVTFQDMLTQTLSGASGPSGNLGGTNPQQIGLGVGLAGIDTDFSGGSIQGTGKNTDLGISGNGFFIVSDGLKDYYTRNGAFEFDEAGNFVLPGSGMHVKGWMADADGNVSANGQITNIVVPTGQSIAAVKTTKVEVRGNLSAGAPVGYIYTMTGRAAKDMPVGADVYDAKGNVIGSVTEAGVAGADFTFKTKEVASEPPAQIYDSATHDLSADLSTPTAATTKSIFEMTAQITGQQPAVGAKVYDPVTGNVIGEVTRAAATAGGTFTFKTNSMANAAPASVSLVPGITTNPADIATPDTSVPISSIYTMTTTAVKDMAVGDAVYDAAGKILGTVTVAAPAGATFTFETVKINGTASTPTAVAVPPVVPTAVFDGADGAAPANMITIDPTTNFVSKAGGVNNSSAISFTAYDSQGIGHIVRGTLVKSDTNEWKFTPDSLTDGGATVTGEDITVRFDASGKIISGSGALTITPADPPLGSAPLVVNVDFTGLSQYGGATNTAVEQDGNAAGTLDSVTIDSSGMVVGAFSNGLKKNLAQVALATFNNPAGLEKSGSSLYSKSNNSGEVQINAAGVGGAGTLNPASIEMSNVNLSDQFSDMIITQRGFQSNSKIITVSDEMIETLVNMKR